jgi:hypothetical protein
MRDWVAAAGAGYVLLLITFVVVVALLDRNHRRADRAVRVLRMLLVVMTGAGITGLVRLHQVGLL